MKAKLKLSAIVLLILGATGLQAQEVVSAAGGDAMGSGGSESYSIGQVAYSTYSVTTGSIAEGVEQPYEITAMTGINSAIATNLSISVFPNPTSADLVLKVDASGVSDIRAMQARLYDINGKILESRKITGEETSISMSELNPGTYFLKVMRIKKASSQTIRTFKITKAQ